MNDNTWTKYKNGNVKFYKLTYGSEWEIVLTDSTASVIEAMKLAKEYGYIQEWIKDWNGSEKDITIREMSKRCIELETFYGDNQSEGVPISYLDAYEKDQTPRVVATSYFS